MKYFIDSQWSYDGGVIPAGMFEPETATEIAVVSNIVTAGFALPVNDRL